MPLPILMHAAPILIHAYPILIPLLGFRLSAPYLNTCIPYLNTLTQLPFSAPYLNTLPTRLGSTLGSRQPIRIEHPRLSATNQNRVLRHPSRQPIRIEYYITRVVITSPESFRLGVKTLLGSRLESAR